MLNKGMNILVWLTFLSYCSAPGSAARYEAQHVITIDRLGFDKSECCVRGICPCSNLAFALENAKNSTEFRILSDIPLQQVVVSKNVSSIMITGHNNPTIMCDHQGGIVGNFNGNITLQSVTLDKCIEIVIQSFMHAQIANCHFQHSSYITFASTMYCDGSVVIENSTFFNSSSVFVATFLAQITKSIFHDAVVSEALVISECVHEVTINGCSFSNNTAHSIKLVGVDDVSPQPTISIVLCQFLDNADSAIYIRSGNLMLIGNVVFIHNEVNDSDGAAIRAVLSKVTFRGKILFNSSKARNGGALYLENSDLYMYQGSAQFLYNSAKNGGSMYVVGGLSFYSNHTALTFMNNIAMLNGGAMYIAGSTIASVYINQTVLTFMNNSAMLNGGAAFFDLNGMDMQKPIVQYYELVTNSRCGENNTANASPNCAYFNVICEVGVPVIPLKGRLFTSPPCVVNISNATAILNDRDDYFNYDDQLLIWQHELHFDIIVTDYFSNLIGPVNGSASFFEARFNYMIDSIHHNITYHDTQIQLDIGSDLSDDFRLLINFIITEGSNSASKDIEAPIQWGGNCSADIMHILWNGTCFPLACQLSNFDSYSNQLCKLGLQCETESDGSYYLKVTPGYWYDNGFQQYVISCPSGHCDSSFDLSNHYDFNSKLDRNSQCLQHWTGLACGECSSVNYSIRYDTTECVSVNQCITDSVFLNLLLLLSVSFLYWCLVIAFIFVLLHFQFNITAGYAYGVLFYYSVLEPIVNQIIDNDHGIFHYSDASGTLTLRLEALPFLSNIGYLKVPFLKYLRICLAGAETIDHVFISYIHPLIVSCLVLVMFITARRFVLVARLIGRYINSKSICLVLLLSYSSVCYTSVQLLQPLSVFTLKPTVWKWHSYLSPTVRYFHGRHILYGIIAILCELIIGIGLPVVILTQRYLIRYFNLKLIAIKPVIDQLQGCYKEKYRWFAAYYLLCRQVIYATIFVSSILSATWNKSAEQFYDCYPTKNTSGTIVMIVCIFMFAIHLWLHPYKKKSLNTLDAVILLTLVLMVISSINGEGWDDGITMAFWILPLLLLVNYLAYDTKLKHLLIPVSCIGIFCMVIILTLYSRDYGDLYEGIHVVPELFYSLWMFGIFHVFFLLLSFVTLMVYVIGVLKYMCTRRRHRRDYQPINRQDDDDIGDFNDSDDNAVNR